MKQKKSMDLLKSLNTRPLLADRLQLIFSPSFTSIDFDAELLYDSILQLYFDRSLQKEIGVKIERPKGFVKYLTLSPEFVGDPQNQYFQRVRISLTKPYSITTEFNFTRYLKHHVKDLPSFQQDYDSSIVVNETNYLNNETWTKWDLGFVSRLRKDLDRLFYWFAFDIWDAVLPNNQLLPKHVGLPHVEFNREYFVGSGNSLFVINRLQEFFISDRGASWRHELGMLGVNMYGADPKFSVKSNVINTNKGQTFKFYMGAGIWFKIYRKTKDHIRAEVGFENSFINRKYKTRSYSKVFNRLRCLAQETIKKANIEGIIHLATCDTVGSPDPLSVSNDFLDRLFSGGCLSNLCKQIDSGTAISDPELVNFIRSHSKISKLFSSNELEKSTKPAYFYDPYGRIRQNYVDSFRVDRIVPPGKLW
jgi:hypothetical protein